MTGPTAHVVTVGIAGDVPGASLAALLGLTGVPVVSRVVVEDDEAALEHALRSEAALTVILTGAGGSAGDIVRRVLARATGSRLVLNDRVLRALEEHWQRHDRPLPRRAERLALLPQGATAWLTEDGEPAWLLEAGGRLWIALPPAAAAEAALAERLLPALRERLAGRGAIVVRTLRTAGVTIGDLEDRLADWLGKDGDVAVATVPVDGEVWVRLRARATTAAEAEQALAGVEPLVVAALGADCYGRDAESLEEVVGRRLLARGLTLAVAESCTGGLLGHRLTSIAGASEYFERGVVVYSNRAKQELLGVPESVLRAHGAVSAACAEAMVRGITERSGSACGLSVTGIAGPGGGTPTKPVGTVFIGLAVPGEVVTRHFRFAGDRAAIKWQASQMALDMLRRRLVEP